jgi:hypothetical protein
MFSLNTTKQSKITYCQNKRTRYGNLIRTIECHYSIIMIEWLYTCPNFFFERPGRGNDSHGPSILRFRGGSNTPYLVLWYLKGRLGRVGDKPAAQRYNDLGDLELEEWYFNGYLHRLGGPAHIRYYFNMKDEQWFYNGDKVK